MSKIALFVFMLAATAVSMADEAVRTISVSGTGSVEVAPDKATLTLSIVARAQTVAAAQSEAAEVTAKVLALTDDMDIPRSLVDTTAASVRPDYRWNREREEQELRGYIAERQMRIELRDLDKLGDVVEAAVEAGVNQVSPPQLESSKQRDAYRDALDAAATDARANASRLADALDIKLGRAIRIDAGSTGRPPMPIFGARQVDMAMAQAVEAPETYNAADMKVTATINVVFELVNGE